jgi:hypothetical protein
MITRSEQNYFTYWNKSIQVALIDKNAAISGEVMKGYNYRLPDILEELHEELNKNKPQIGSCYLIGGKYLFIVARENYHYKWNTDVLSQIWKVILPQISKKVESIIIDTEDYPSFGAVVEENDTANNKFIIADRACWDW